MTEELGLDITKHKEIMEQAYGQPMLKLIDTVEGSDLYGIMREEAIRYFSSKLALTKDSHVLDIGCGIGGPARFLARNYGCKVTGVDINELNYVIAVERTKTAQLEDSVTFICGNLFELPLPS